MASRRELEQELKLLKDIEAKRNDILGQKVKGAFEGMSLQSVINDFDSIDDALRGVKLRMNAVNAEIRDLRDGVSDFKGLTEAITAEFGRVDTTLTKVARSYRKINGIASQLTDINLDLANSSTKDVQKLKQKNDLEFKRLKALTTRANIELDLKKAELEGETDPKKAEKLKDEINQMESLVKATEDQADALGASAIAFKNVEKRLANINKIAGIGTGLIAGLGAALGKVGFDGLASSFEKGAAAARELSVEIEEAIEEGQFNRFSRFLLRSAGSIAALGQGIRTTLLDGLGQLFSPQGLLIGGITLFIKQFTHLDSAISNVAKGMGLTNAAATELTLELKNQAVASDEIGVSMDRLISAQLEISKQLGTNVKLTAQQLEDQVFLNTYVGLQGESLKNSLTASLLLGKSQEEIFDTIVKNNDGVYQSAALFEEAVNTTGQIAVNLGNNPAKIAQAVREAKRLGINLDTARSMSDGVLDFSSSITAEMEASVLLGRSINLNHARELAFRNDHVGAAKEMLRQVGGMEKFGKMNNFQQKALADSMNLSVDALAEQLRMADQDIKLTEQANKIRRENPALTQEEALLKARDENRTIGETINDITTRLGDIFGSLAKGPLKAIRGLLANTDQIVGGIREGFTEVFKKSDGTTRSLASMLPSAEELKIKGKEFGEFLGKAFNFIKSIPGRIKGITESPFFQMISGLFSSTGGKIAIAGAGIGVLGKMLLGRGSPTNPMHVIFSKGGALLDGLKNIFKKKGPANLAKMAGKPGAGAVMKATGKKVYGAAATSAVKAGTASVAKTGGKSIAKQAGKLGAKALGKSLLKKIPGVGLLAGVGFGLQRALSGDFAGAALELASGAASTIPGIGTAASLAADAALVARDISRAKELNELQQTVDAPAGTQEVPVTDFVIKPLNEDTITMAGGTKLGGNVEALLQTLIDEVRNGGDVVMDGIKVGHTLSAASYKL